MKTPTQLLRDKDIQPTPEVIARGLGDVNSTFVKFIRELEQDGITLMDWRFYDDGKAWLSKAEYRWTTARGTNKVKPLFWLSIWDGFFKVSFSFAESVREELLGLPVSEATKTLIAESQPNGKTMRFIAVIFDVYDDAPLADIYTLAQFRKVKVK